MGKVYMDYFDAVNWLANTTIDIDNETAKSFMNANTTCNSAEELELRYQFKPGDHPGIEESTGNLLYTQYGSKLHAVKYFVKGSGFGLSPKRIVSDSYLSMAVGGCHSWLLNGYNLSHSNQNDEVARKFFMQAYLYLSLAAKEYVGSPYPIEQRMHIMKNYSHTLVTSIRPFPQLIVAPQIIADALNLYMLFKDSNPNKAAEYYEVASSEHEDLDMITVNGVEADEYSLGDLAKIGLIRHEESLNICKEKNHSGTLELTDDEFETLLGYIVNIGKE
jgi:hypothetical protein